jgi:hypothetical protein
MDGEVYKAIKDSAESEFNKEYDAMSSGEKEAERERIIKQQYGENAKIDDEGNVTDATYINVVWGYQA